MKTPINIFVYTSYRQFLADWLKEKGLSYRAFAARFAGAISLIALAKLLSRGRSRGEERGDYRISPEALARLGRHMHLSYDELRHLILLRLENDAEVLPGQYGSSFQQTMRDLVAENRLKKSEKEQAGPNATGGGTETGIKLFELFEVLPNRLRLRLLEEAVLQGKIYAARQTGKTGVKALQSLLRELNRLKDMGAP